MSHWLSRYFGLPIFLVLLSAPGRAHAQVERFAILAGNNRGAADEADLRYAESDVNKMYDVLTELGGFRPEDVVVLRGRDASAFRQALIAVNERIRMRVATDRQVMLLVYYSGHADEQALHLGDSSLRLRELEQMVNGSAADFRLLIVDACRSGALTLPKGGHSRPPFSIEVDERLAGQGAVYLTSASASEDAQESSLLKGSFFTHYLVSAMLGAADGNGDGKVVLTEAYRYAYEHTLRASSRTLAGIQHPSFRYDLAGQGDVVLTWPASSGDSRARVRVPEGLAFLLFRDSEDGAVVAEVGVADRRRTLSIKPGRYFVRGRGRQHLLQGTVVVRAGETRIIAASELERIEYARLVRKGGADISSVRAIETGYRVRTAIHEGASPCHGGTIGYRLDYQQLGLITALGVCRSGFTNAYLSATNDELDLSVRLVHAWDLTLAPLAVELGVSAGTSWLYQHFETRGRAPSRSTVTGYLGVGLGLRHMPGSGLLVGADAEFQTYGVPIEREPGGPSEYQARLGIRGALLLGKHF